MEPLTSRCRNEARVGRPADCLIRPFDSIGLTHGNARYVKLEVDRHHPAEPPAARDVSHLTRGRRSTKLPPSRRRAAPLSDRRSRTAPPLFLRGKLQRRLWKCGKLNFSQIAGFPFCEFLRRPEGPSRFPFAPSTERE